MQTSELVSICALGVSFLTFVFTLIRDNKKKFQETLYDLKMNAYKTVIVEIGLFIDDLFELLDTLQFYEGSKEEWEIEIQNIVPKYYEKAYKINDIFYEYILVLPEDSIKKIDEIRNLGIGHITNHYHFDTEIVINSYDRLSLLYQELISLGRKDLGVNSINTSLNKRIARNLYPLGLKNEVKE